MQPGPYSDHLYNRVFQHDYFSQLSSVSAYPYTVLGFELVKRWPASCNGWWAHCFHTGGTKHHDVTAVLRRIWTRTPRDVIILPNLSHGCIRGELMLTFWSCTIFVTFCVQCLHCPLLHVASCCSLEKCVQNQQQVIHSRAIRHYTIMYRYMHTHTLLYI